MKFKDFSGRLHVFNFDKICKEAPNPSALHLSARQGLKAIFPSISIYEEVQLLGTGLIADFFIPSMLTMVEVHGEQHYKFVKMFHKTTAGFKLAQKRDKLKQEWCDINNVVYIELPFDKTKEWSSIIKGYL